MVETLDSPLRWTKRFLWIKATITLTDVVEALEHAHISGYLPDRVVKWVGPVKLTVKFDDVVAALEQLTKAGSYVQLAQIALNGLKALIRSWADVPDGTVNMAIHALRKLDSVMRYDAELG